ncbi:MAG: tetratricopeptide repeat protein, partial [Candidatus Omnitrophica bacterium]|nr:tetratricopeptide repeat protein [Candidatus Omnitrophota bacterium]
MNDYPAIIWGTRVINQLRLEQYMSSVIKHLKKQRIAKFIFKIILVILLINVNTAMANTLPPEINPQNQFYNAQYFLITIPKDWIAQEVYGHEDIEPGQDGFLVFSNNMGKNIDIFSVSFYDPKYPQYNIVISVKNNVEILKLNHDKSISTYLLERYFEQQGYSQFRSHNGSVFVGSLSGYESLLEISNEQGRLLTYDAKRLETDNYIYVIEHYNLKNFSDKTNERLDEIINSFQLKSPSLNIATISPQLAEDYFHRGSDYENRGDFSNAISDYSKAIELNPSYAGALNNRGSLYEKQGDFSQAMSDYNKALLINPRFEYSYNNRGLLYFEQKNFTEALSDYNKAIEINTNFSEAYNNRGALYEEQNNVTQAMLDYNKAIELNPGFAKAYYNRG